MIRLEKYTRAEWARFSRNAHLIAFKEIREPGMDRFDFALMAVREIRPMAYVTCREFDAETLYWQFGGAFPETKGTSGSWEAYSTFMEWTKARYKRVTTIIENTNTAMLRMAMKIGFRVVGIRYVSGSILLEHLLEFGA